MQDQILLIESKIEIILKELAIIKAAQIGHNLPKLETDKLTEQIAKLYNMKCQSNM